MSDRTDGFADTELADNVSPLFPMREAPPAKVATRAAVHRGYPSSTARLPEIAPDQARMAQTTFGDRRRTAAALEAAHASGYTKGYRSGTHWGMLCGAVGAAVLAGIGYGFLSWLRS